MWEGVAGFLRQLEAEKGFSSNTISAYKNDLNQFITFLTQERGVTSWQELSDEHLKAYTLYLREREYATSTVARKTAAIRSFDRSSASAVTRESRSAVTASMRASRSRRCERRSTGESRRPAACITPTAARRAVSTGRRNTVILRGEEMRV